MSHHTILGPTARHERFMREVTRELDAFEQHERGFAQTNAANVWRRCRP
jgi:hypothetical protein